MSIRNRQQPSGLPCFRYNPFPAVDLPDRQWPSRTITAAPRWLSTDLRDGNQALIDPMNGVRKHAMFDLLVRMGYKEIEVGFPAASQTDFDFVRELIEGGKVPDDVRISVLTQAREDLIERTVQSLIGSHSATVHMYNAAAPLFRRVVFGFGGDGRAECRSVAVSGTQHIMKFADYYLPGTEFGLEYSPEIFMDTELEFSLEICEAVMDVWQPDAEREIVLNLPCTVERSTPNVYADQIEWMSRNLSRREFIALSVHTHNDRGTATADAELAQAGRRGPGRGVPVRQRRAQRQRRPGDPRAEPVQPGRRPADRLLRHRRDPAHRRVLQPHRRARAAPVRRRPGLHVVLRLAPGRDQEGLRGPREARCRGGTGRRRDAVADALPADRPEGRRPLVRGGHPGELAVRQGRRRVHHEVRPPPRPAASAADRVQSRHPAAHRGRGRRGRRRS